MDELRPLIADGHDKGFLTIEQIAASLQEVEVTKEQVSELHGYLVDQGIDIVGVDGKPVLVDSRLAADSTDTDRQAAKTSDARKQAIDLTVEPSLDSLRLYL